MQMSKKESATSTSDLLPSQRDAILNLTNEKNRLVAEGKYLEASKIKAQITQLKQQSQLNKSQNLSVNQEKQRSNLEDAFNSEYSTLLDEWNTKIQTFIQNGKQKEKELNDLHNQQLETLINNLTSNYPPMKYSKEYLTTKAKELELAKQEQFEEAQHYRFECAEIEKNEIEKYNNKRNTDIQLKAEILVNKQATEKKCLREKLDMQFDLMNSQKDKELNQLALKYKNLQSELDYFHNKQKHTNKNKTSQQRANDAIERINNNLVMTIKNKSNNSTMIMNHNQLSDKRATNKDASSA